MIEWVDKSKVELINNSASDNSVAFAAWVSNFDKDDLPVEVPSESDFNAYRESLRPNFSDYYDRYYSKELEAVKKFNSRVGGLIDFLYREKHMSPFEHGSMTFYVDTPIFVAREFMRHRTFSYNETSGRYREMKPRFFLVGSERPLVQQGKVGAYTFVPGTDEQYGNVFAQTTSANVASWNAYQSMLSSGVAREVARDVLPVNIMTQFYVTGNPRNWMQFLTLRNDKNALKEIRDIAVEIEEHFAEKMPLTYKAYKKYDWRSERDELAQLRKRVAQYEAEETYSENITAGKDEVSV